MDNIWNTEGIVSCIVSSVY